MLDYRDNKWSTFDIQPILPELAVLAAKYPYQSEPQPEPPVQVFVPPVVIDGPQVVTGDPHYGDDEPIQHMTYQTLNPLVAEAIMQQESGNIGFNDDGSLKIRTEAHLLLNPNYGNPDAMQGHFRYNPDDLLQAWYLDESGQWVEYHRQGQLGEWNALELAMRLDRNAALRCISMGASQVMGFNHKKIGYETVEEMYQAFSRSQNVHALGFVNYCLATPGLPEAINALDWPTIGRLYNGSQSAGDLYRARYEELTR